MKKPFRDRYMNLTNAYLVAAIPRFQRHGWSNQDLDCLSDALNLALKKNQDIFAIGKIVICLKYATCVNPFQSQQKLTKFRQEFERLTRKAKVNRNEVESYVRRYQNLMETEVRESLQQKTQQVYVSP
jgi:hypothetical protein